MNELTMTLHLHLARARRLLSAGRQPEAAALLLEMMKRPDHFWVEGRGAKSSKPQKRFLKTDGTWGVYLVERVFSLEEVGVAVLEVAEQVEERGARLELVARVAAEARRWRPLPHKAAIDKYHRNVPATLTRCAASPGTPRQVRGAAAGRGRLPRARRHVRGLPAHRAGGLW